MSDASNNAIMPIPDDELWTLPEGPIRPFRQNATIGDYDPNIFNHTPTPSDTHTTTSTTPSTK